MEGEARSTLEGDSSVSLMPVACFEAGDGSLGFHQLSQC